LLPSRRNSLLERWVEALLDTPGLTAVTDPVEAWGVHVDGSLVALEHVLRFPGAIVDVGSGGGTPGIPLAISLPDREVTLLDSSARKCAFLERCARELPNVRVVRGRAEEQEPDRFGVAVARALAQPPVALEWCLPLVAPGGAAVLLVGPTVEVEQVARVSERLGGGPPEAHPGALVVPKLGPTPAGFPRRPGAARKRPLA
jgi:16S rRNA (guanine527-N7)-methyltransferase